MLAGLYTEASPESLPAGASPLTLNCDYTIGQVNPRPGKQNKFYYSNFFTEKVAGFASSIAGPQAPNETPWINPSNATLNTPGSYATASLNIGGGGGGTPYLDKAVSNSGNSGAISASATPASPTETAFFVGTVHATPQGVSPTVPAGFTLDYEDPNDFVFYKFLNSLSTVTPSSTLGLAGTWAGAMALIFGNVSVVGGSSGSLNTGSGNITRPGVTNGNSLMAIFLTPAAVAYGGTGVAVNYVVTDDKGNSYSKIADSFNNPNQATIFFAQNVVGGSVKLSWTGSQANGLTMRFIELSGVVLPASASYSQILNTLNYPVTIPSTQNIMGMQVEVSGSQTSLAAAAILKVQFVNPDGTLSSVAQTGQLPLVDGTIALGQPLDHWGLTLTPALLTNPNFAVNVTASALDGTPVSFQVFAVKLKVWLTPASAPDIFYLKTFSETGGELLNLFLGSDGVIYQEDAINNPGVLTGVYTAIQPESFAQSCTQSDREFIAISNLKNGTDIPYSYNGTNFDRLSQVGPGAAPTCSSSSTGSAITSITQNPSVPLLTGAHDWLLVSDSPSDIGAFGAPATPGNVFTIIFRSATAVPSYIKAGSSIVIAGFPTINGNVVNNDPAGITAPKFYTVTSVGQAIPGQQSYDAITFIVPFTTFHGQLTPAGCTIQATLATMTTAVQVPNLEVGNQFQVSGTGGAPPAGYDNTWQVTGTPNAAQLQITSTALTGNVATYGFNLISGVIPVIGQAITVTQTLNGNGIFNVASAIITAVTPGSFSVNLVGANISATAENGAAIIFGTIFEFDAFQVIGNKLGGTIITVGVIAAGVRKCCYSFKTRDGYITQPSPIVTFTVAAGASSIAVANLLVGPSNVEARIIFLTPANGGNFYAILVPVPVISNGVTVINSATAVNDNTSTGVNLSFSDGVLLAGFQADVQGNNLFETAELGAPTMLLPYAGRLFAIGEQNKVTNFLNWSFDGGVVVVQSTAGAGGGAGINSTYPAGWIPDPANGTGGSVAASPIFGNAYKISNTTGITKAIWGMITQPAFQDEFQVAIIQPSTAYSVRVTVSVPTGPTTGHLIIDLFSPSLGVAVGTFSLDLSTVGITMGIFTGTLLTTTLAPVPNDLVLRLYGTNILDGTTILVDREEPFPTEQPNLGTQITGSYKLNFEAFDQVTGVIDGRVQNQQPIVSAFVLFDTLYMVKSGSLISSGEVGGQEPANWNTPRVVSNSVGTTSIYGVTTGIDEPNSGEEWAIIAGQPGAFIFNGGQPIKLTEEIQSLWNLINWKYGHTLWVKNDIVNRRILFGVPMKTQTTSPSGAIVQNPWIPAGIIPDDANPTTPNIILELNYKQLNTANQLADRPEVHVSFSGKLIASEVVRKWSVWTINAPAAAFLTQADTTTPLFLGNSDDSGKVFRLIDDLLEDDGAAFAQIYMPSVFPTFEQAREYQLGAVRKTFEYMTLLIQGTGPLEVDVFPNTLDTPYSHALLPNITLPASTNGDVEVPINECATRLFIQFKAFAVGAGFKLSKMVVMMRQEAWAPSRGINN